MQSANLSLVRGDDQDVGINVTQPDGSTYNLSGCLLTFTARQNTYNSIIVLQKVVTGSGSAALTGLATLSFTSGDTASFNDNPYFYDIRLLSTGLKTTTLVYGQFSLFPK